eukprot:scaffold143_cov260-Pinguiococcus_pyrenoidosus.AAC.63
MTAADISQERTIRHDFRLLAVEGKAHSKVQSAPGRRGAGDQLLQGRPADDGLGRFVAHEARPRVVGVLEQSGARPPGMKRIRRHLPSRAFALQFAHPRQTKPCGTFPKTPALQAVDPGELLAALCLCLCLWLCLWLWLWASAWVSARSAGASHSDGACRGAERTAAPLSAGVAAFAPTAALSPTPPTCASLSPASGYAAEKKKREKGTAAKGRKAKQTKGPSKRSGRPREAWGVIAHLPLGASHALVLAMASVCAKGALLGRAPSCSTSAPRADGVVAVAV